MPKFHNIFLQHRDEKIIEYLFRYRVATIYQIIRDLEFTSDRTAICKRLKQLVRGGYLVSHWYEKKKVYSLGKSGQRYLFDKSILPNTYKLQHLGNVITKSKHDLLLNDIYSHIENIEMVKSLKTHNQIMVEKCSNGTIGMVPDGIFVINNGKGEVPIAVELELSPKPKNHYVGILLCYHENIDISAVTYLVPNHALRRLILKQNRGFEEIFGQKIYVGLVDDFLSNSQICDFKTSTNKSVSIQEIALHSKVHRLCNIDDTVSF